MKNNNLLKRSRLYLLLFPLAAMLIYIVLLSYRYYYFRKKEVIISYEVASPAFFCWPNSYQVSDTIRIYAHATSPYLIKVGRVEKDSIVLVHSQASKGHREQNNEYSLKYGCDWSMTDMIPLDGFSPGLYMIEVASKEDESESWVSPILVRSAEGRDIVVVTATNTWQAYNTFGGKSNYVDVVTPKDVKYLNEFLSKVSRTSTLAPYTYLPQKRPYLHGISRRKLNDISKSLNGKISSDLYLIEYLESLGLKYDVISDTDFEKGIGINNAKLIIFHNHSEYWSYEGIGLLKQMVARGKNILFLSGNNMYREVESVKGNTLIVMEQVIDRKAIEPILGTYYSESGYEMPFASFKVFDDSHWIFKDTNLKNGDSFGEDIISGIETDKLGPYSEGFELLAIGDNLAGPAHLVFKEFEGGNFLINASSISSVRVLESSNEWRKIVENIIYRGIQEVEQSN